MRFWSGYSWRESIELLGHLVVVYFGDDVLWGHFKERQQCIVDISVFARMNNMHIVYAEFTVHSNTLKVLNQTLHVIKCFL